MIDMEQDADQARAAKEQEKDDAAPVQITGVDVPFEDLMWLLVKLALAAIPAGIIIGLCYWVISGLIYAALMDL